MRIRCAQTGTSALTMAAHHGVCTASLRKGDSPEMIAFKQVQSSSAAPGLESQLPRCSKAPRGEAPASEGAEGQAGEIPVSGASMYFMFEVFISKIHSRIQDTSPTRILKQHRADETLGECCS